jgi:hypothetical protein
MKAFSRAQGRVLPLALLLLTACGGGGGDGDAGPDTPPVVIAAPAISYAEPSVAFATGAAANVPAPQNTGGTPASWTIQPTTLPAGLSFNATDGTVTGTPTAVAAATNYTVTATNSGGQSQATVSITVINGVLLELGHASGVTHIRISGNRALSQDSSGHWNLWNLSSGEIVVSGDTPCVSSPTCTGYYLPVDLAGNTVVLQTAAGLETRSATDGHVLATVTTSLSSWNLASDGTYLIGVNSAALTAWLPSGTVQVTKTGNYSNAVVFPAPTEIRVAKGAAGVDVIETIGIFTGASTISPQFAGQFHSWFVDGERFLAKLNSNVWVYSKNAVQQDFLTLLGNLVRLTGQGNYFWFINIDQLNVYEVGASSAPVATYAANSGAYPSGLKIAVPVWPYKRVRIVDLAGASPSDSELALPIYNVSAYAAGGGSSWLLGTGLGVVVDGASLSATARFLALGAALGVAGARDRIVVALATEQILYFDSDTRQFEGAIPFITNRFSLSADGAVLVAARGAPAAMSPVDLDDLTVKAYALPAGTVINTWPYTRPSPLGGDWLINVALSPDGGQVGLQFITDYYGRGFRWDVMPIGGGSLIFSGGGRGPIFFSLDGALIAPSPRGRDDFVGLPIASTSIYRDGALVTAVPGEGIGWVQGDRLLVNEFTNSSGVLQQVGMHLYSATGIKLSTTGIPEIHGIQPLTETSIYSREKNTIYSLTDGAALWTSSNQSSGAGAVAGPVVVFASGTQIRVEPY